MDAVPVSSLTFTETEKKYYTAEFDRWTKAEKKPITERVTFTQKMTGPIAVQVFKKTKLSDTALKIIWDLASEGQPFLMQQNFLAAMRMCSILKQKKELSWDNIRQVKDPSESLPVSQSSPPENEFETVKLDQEEDEEVKISLDSAPTSLESHSSAFMSSDPTHSGVELPPYFEVELPPHSGVQLRSHSEVELPPRSGVELRPHSGVEFPPHTRVEPPPRLFETSGSGIGEVQDIDLEENKEAPAILPTPAKIVLKAANIEKTHPPPLPRIDEESPSHYSPTAMLSIEVTNPRTVSAGWFGSSYTLYTVVSKQTRITQTDRRFRDLDWMHTQLCAQFKGMSIPPRPDKQYFGSLSAQFIEERRAQMEKYLNMVAAHPMLRTCEVFKTFLTCPLEQFEEEKVRVEKEVASVSYHNVEDVMDHLVAKIHSKINSTLISNFAPQSTDVLQLDSQLNRLSFPTTELSTKFAAWVHSERDLLAVSHAIDLPDNHEFNATLTAFETMDEAALREMETQAMDLKEEVMRIEGLSNAIATYRETSEQYAEQEALIQRKKGKHRAALDEDSAARYQNEIDSADEVLEQLKADLEKIQLNVTQDSLHFTESRERHLKETLLRVTESQCKRWSRNAQFWRKKGDAALSE